MEEQSECRYWGKATIATIWQVGISLRELNDCVFQNNNTQLFFYLALLTQEIICNIMFYVIERSTKEGGANVPKRVAVNEDIEQAMKKLGMLIKECRGELSLRKVAMRAVSPRHS